MTILNLVFPTAIVSVIDSQNKLVQCPALLDCGSQHSFITEKLVDALNLNKDDVNLNLSGIGGKAKGFWEVETLPRRKLPTEVELRCEKIFQETTIVGNHLVEIDATDKDFHHLPWRRKKHEVK